ncbi:MAG: MFS transporter [Candidatus Latescibacteria bacterium]|nr:MFS transporter [Candidatus Latescibacterota bacterium]
MKRSWKRNFYILWVAELVAIIGFQAIQPFLPYYIQQLDVESLDEALLWAGYMGTAGGLAMALSAPVWGAVADRWGRKPMVVRSMLGGGLTVLGLAYASSAEQVLVLRTLQGLLAGTVTACITLVSTSTPRAHQAFALGLMQGAFMLGGAVGPFFGGIAIERFGYHYSLLGGGLLVLLAGVVVWVFVHEDFTRPQRRGGQSTWRGFYEDSRQLLRGRAYRILLLCLVLMQFSFGVVIPIVPLFLQQLSGSADILSQAGSIFALAGLAGALASVFTGKVSERYGARRTLVVGLLITALFFAGQGMATSVVMLGALIVVGSLVTGGLRPVLFGLVAQVVPEDARGKAFGLMTSASALGWALGPGLGGNIGAVWGFPPVFFGTAVLFIFVALWSGWALQGISQPAAAADSKGKG